MDVDGSGLDGTCLEGANQRPKRVLLKLSGEVLTLPGQSGINIEETLKAAAQIKLLVELGVQPAVVVGGGNILRGAQFSSGTTVIKKATAHHCHEWNGPARGFGKPGVRDAPANRHSDGERCRAFHPPTRGAPP